MHFLNYYSIFNNCKIFKHHYDDFTIIRLSAEDVINNTTNRINLEVTQVELLSLHLI